jgi:hypothetical protein
MKHDIESLPSREPIRFHKGGRKEWKYWEGNRRRKEKRLQAVWDFMHRLCRDKAVPLETLHAKGLEKGFTLAEMEYYLERVCVSKTPWKTPCFEDGKGGYPFWFKTFWTCKGWVIHGNHYPCAEKIENLPESV